MDELRALFDQPQGAKLLLAGVGPFTEDQAKQSEKELLQAELISGPFALLILLAVFASVVAAGLPLLVAALTIPTTLAAVFFVAQTTELSIYVQNVATMLGLALAIDYSLFMVSRFREELRRGRSVQSAVEIMVATAGKAVAFSGLAVAIGLSGLLLFEPAALRSFGIGGSLVVAASVFYALTFLPAVLGMLGPRVNALSIAGLFAIIRRAIGRPAAATGATRTSRWERVAHTVMARPFVFLIPTLAFLLFAGTPFLRLSQGIPNASTLPPGLESRDAAVALERDFRPGETSPITILATVEGDPTSEANLTAIAEYAAAIDALDGIDRVEGPFSALSDPQTGAEPTPADVAALFAAPREQLPPELVPIRDQVADAYIHGSTVRLDAISPIDPVSPAGTAIIPLVRAVAVEGVTTEVGGLAAQGRDFMTSQSGTVPWAVGITLAASALILFLLFGSVIIPIKAVIMTLLSITASFGALVWIFQDGNLSGILGFESPGIHDRRQPDHHVQCPVRAVDGLRGPAAVPDPGGVPADRRQHGVGRRGPDEDRRRDHRRGPDHGRGLLRVRPRRVDHDQEHRRRDGDRGPDRRDDHPGPPRPGDDAADGPLELVGAGAARAVRRPARLQPRRG